MNCRFLIGLPLGFMVLVATVVPAWAAPRANLTLFTEDGFPITGSQRWSAALAESKFSSVKIRGASETARLEVKKQGSGDDATYEITGILTARNTLRLPGGEFRLGDTAGIGKWLDSQLAGGGGAGGRPAAFGLSAEELVAIHEALSTPVNHATKGERSYDVLKKIAAGVGLSFSADPAATAAMAADTTVAEELRGLSSGTAIAAILRPLGLVMAPRKSAGEVKLAILDVRQANESWPVGWPLEAPPREALPELFQFLNVEIKDTPLASALDAIGGRVKAPILFDHNSLARHRIDPAQIKVTLPSGRTYYKKIIDTLLNQAQLTNEIRQDEAGQAFLWITTLKR